MSLFKRNVPTVPERPSRALDATTLALTARLTEEREAVEQWLLDNGWYVLRDTYEVKRRESHGWHHPYLTGPMVYVSAVTMLEAALQQRKWDAVVAGARKAAVR